MAENPPRSGEIDLASSELPSQEAQLRQALESMGGRRLGSSPAAQAASSRQAGPNSTQRHRYVRDGEVPVVHATLGRPPAKPDAAAQQIVAQQALDEAAAPPPDEPAAPLLARRQPRAAKTRPTKTPREHEPEPVKWWIKSEKT